MAITPEGRVKARLKLLLKKHKAHYFMPVQGGYGAAHLDFIICHQGRFAAVETKAGNKKMTKRQEVTAKLVTEAGGVAFLYNDETDGGLEQWLESCVL